MRAAMPAQRNKVDSANALGLAHIVLTGWFKAAFINSEPCYQMRLLLTQRRNLKRKFHGIENSIRHSLKAFGIRFKVEVDCSSCAGADVGVGCSNRSRTRSATVAACPRNSGTAVLSQKAGLRRVPTTKRSGTSARSAAIALPAAVVSTPKASSSRQSWPWTSSEPIVRG